MSHAPDLSMAHTGDILGGRYILRERLGAGGMGRVFRARDEVLARDVAIKIFHADDGGGSEQLRRMSEARALAALTHPSLVTLFDARLVGEEHVYLVMELIAGPSLQRRIEEGAIPAGELAGILSDLAGALAVVHDAGIVHRDVKPSNVLLRPLHGADRDAEAVLADFGVAHLIDTTRLTTPGTVIGTAAYLAPEQVRGEPPQAASDIYSLGLLALEALTRLHPFGVGSLQENLLARLARQPEIPESLHPRWRELLLAMTAADAGARPTAAAVAACASALVTEETSLDSDATEHVAGWMLPTAALPLASVPTSPGPAATGSPARAAAGFATPNAATAPPAGAVPAVPTPAAPDAGASRLGTERRGTDRRHRRRRWSWTLAGAGAVLIVGGHLAAFSLGATHDVTSDRVPAPASSPVPTATQTAPVTDTVADVVPSAPPEATTEPVVDTPPGQESAAEPTPVQPESVVVAPVAVVSSGGESSENPGAGPGVGTPGEPAEASTKASGRTEPNGTGRPESPGRSDDAPGRSDDAGKGRGSGAPGKG